MKITVRELRNIIREGMYSDWMNTAGMLAGGMGISSSRRGTEEGPPGLGSPADQEEDDRLEDEEPEEKSQLAARVNDRHPGRAG